MCYNVASIMISIKSYHNFHYTVHNLIIQLCYNVTFITISVIISITLKDIFIMICYIMLHYNVILIIIYVTLVVFTS